MPDPYKSYIGGLSDPIAAAAAVVPDDAADLSTAARALHIGTGGALRVTLVGQATPVTFAGLAAGWHPIRARRVWASGTTAADIVAGW